MQLFVHRYSSRAANTFVRAFVRSQTSRSAFSALFALLALSTTFAFTAHAQTGGASATPLHLAASRIDFVATSDTQPLTKPFRIHNGGKAQFTDVKISRIAYADSARGSSWVVAMPRQTSVAPDELATIGALCVNATGLPAGTYHARAAVSAREVPEPVPFTIVLVVKDVVARSANASPRCGTSGGR